MNRLEIVLHSDSLSAGLNGQLLLGRIENGENVREDFLRRGEAVRITSTWSVTLNEEYLSTHVFTVLSAGRDGAVRVSCSRIVMKCVFVVFSRQCS